MVTPDEPLPRQLTRTLYRAAFYSTTGELTNAVSLSCEYMYITTVGVLSKQLA
jgi:hypothetical protein